MNFRLDGETRLFLIVGDPIAQVKSPGGLTAMLAERGANAIVAPAHVTAADFADFMRSVRLMRNLGGILVTIPHKFAALSWCDEASERGRFAGAVNVIVRSADGRWHGDNTDGLGYLDGIGAKGFEVAGKAALLVGAGGAGSAIAFEILERGARRLAIHDSDAARRDALIARLAGRFGDRVGAGGADPRGFDLVANATPMGMHEEDPLPVDVTGLSPNQFVADVVTRPEITPLIDHARALGCATMTGTGMFDAQARLLVDRLAGVQEAK